MTVYSNEALKEFRGFIIDPIIVILLITLGMVLSILLPICKHSHDIEMLLAMKDLKAHFIRTGGTQPRAVIQVGASYYTIAVVNYDQKQSLKIRNNLDGYLLSNRMSGSKWTIFNSSGKQYSCKTWSKFRFGQIGDDIKLPIGEISSIIKKTDTSAIVMVRTPSYVYMESTVVPIQPSIIYKWYQINPLLPDKGIVVNGRLTFLHIIWLLIFFIVFGYAIFNAFRLSTTLQKPGITCEDAIDLINRWKPNMCLHLPLLMFSVMIIGTLTKCLPCILDQWFGPSNLLAMMIISLIYPSISIVLIANLVAWTYKRHLKTAIQLEDPDIAPQEKGIIREKCNGAMRTTALCLIGATQFNISVLYHLYHSWVALSPLLAYIIPGIIAMILRLPKVKESDITEEIESWVPIKTQQLTKMLQTLADQMNMRPYPVEIETGKVYKEKLLVYISSRTMYISYAAAKVFTDDEIRFLMASALINKSKKLIPTIFILTGLFIGFVICPMGYMHLIKGAFEKAVIISVFLYLPCMSVVAFFEPYIYYKHALKLTGNPEAASSALRKKIWWLTSRSNASVFFDQDYVALRLLRLPYK